MRVFTSELAAMRAFKKYYSDVPAFGECYFVRNRHDHTYIILNAERNLSTLIHAIWSEVRWEYVYGADEFAELFEVWRYVPQEKQTKYANTYGDYRAAILQTEIPLVKKRIHVKPVEVVTFELDAL